MTDIPTQPESTARVITASLLNTTGTAEIPASARYKLNDATNVIEVVPWTALTPASELEIIITSAQNAKNGQGDQTMELTLEATYSADDLVTYSTRYIINALTFYS